MLSRLRATCVGGVAAIAVSVATATAGWAETLAETLSYTYIHSGVVEQNRALLRAADEDVAQALASLRPVLNWSGSVRRQYGTAGASGLTSRNITHDATVGLTAEIVLYAGGRNRLALDVAKESVLATRADLLSAEQSILLRAAKAFLGIRESAQTLGLRQNNVRVIRQEVRAARDRFDVGEVTRTDVALAEARLAAAVAALAAAEGSLIQAGEEFHAVVGRDPGNLVTPTSLPSLPASVEEAKRQALQRHPDMHAAQYAVAVQELNILIAKGAMKPSVSLQGTYGVTEEFGNDDFSRGGSVSLQASGPIYQGGALASAVRQAMAGRDQARANLHVVSLTIEQQVGVAYSALRVARANTTSFEEQVRAAETAFRGVREEATLGARTTLDVLDAEQELLDARANLISAQISEFSAAYDVLASLGLMTAEALRLDVPHFDPAAYYNLVKTAPVARSKQGQELDRVLRALGKD
ncbi:TolC family outer membrane protein [Sagittula sp.]|uniref:TolC family outer membrane protein n=1 Tax=Sagittula sp. TaxID=2038081 RepID=UPI0035118D74